METSTTQKAERTYDVRIVSHPKVQKALKIEQNKRHEAANYAGPEPRKVDILADWVEEKADAIISGGSE
ncbi:hypothetical protein [Hymenobacter sp. BT559]|uniref:hypothetical protein n=1 Tax=Hymenobacter sp. BT559 TaxID=2795729 RepID=UPI0018EC3DD8|nr:hypothetical protein [Hymenobacter sp. BT559]MBJ6145712.1 hypothetical protein [Hymenobacter sp. BT559]